METKYYELWDLEAGNLIGVYRSEAKALEIVRDGVASDGADLWRSVGLRASEETVGGSRRIATGDDLIAMALSAPAEPADPGDKTTGPMIDGVREGEGVWYAGLPDAEIVANGRIRVTVEDGIIIAEVRPTQTDDIPGVEPSLAQRRRA